MKQEIMKDICKTFPLVAPELKKEARLHIEKLQEEMRKDAFDAVLIAANPNIYYTALRVYRGYVWVPAEGDPLYLVIRPNNLTGDDVVCLRKPEQLPEVLSERGYDCTGTVGMEFGELTYAECTRLMKALPGATVEDAAHTIRRARIVKTDWEIQQMRIDASLQMEAYGKIPRLYREGMTDVELQILIEQELRRHGCLGFPRVSGRLMQINLGSVISGDNADVPTPYDFSMGGAGSHPSLPVGADGREILVGTTVMVDMNGCFNGYQSDLTRTYRVGAVPELAERAHRCSRDILRSLEKMAKPGVPVCDLYKEAERIVKEAGLKDYYMGHCQKVAFIGHGVGIELNELPVVTARNSEPLQIRTTLALEPKFVIPHVGAVGVENTYLVTENGLENLTPCPEELIDLE